MIRLNSKIVESVNNTSDVYHSLSNQMNELDLLNNKIIESMNSMKTNKNAIIDQEENIVTVSSTSSGKVQDIDESMTGQKTKVYSIKDYAKVLEDEFIDLEHKLDRFETN